MHKLVLVRHGESQWGVKKDNRFAGWTDVDLSEDGIAEANKGGELLKQHGLVFDLAYTSVLSRSIRTLWLIMDKTDLMWIPIVHSWRLNERHYGALQGLNRAETAAQYGDEQVRIWRRSYDVQPPALTMDDPRYANHDPRYASLSPEEIPACESLKDVVSRMLPYWFSDIAPSVQSGKRVIVSAHGNSLRALIKHLDNISDADIMDLELPTGVPIVYELDDDLKPIQHYYLES